MRGTDHQQGHVVSYLSPEERVRKDHPLRTVLSMMNNIFIAGMRKLKHRRLHKVGWKFIFATAAYNLVRMRNLSKPAPQSA
jgi:hypothetical protein